MKTATAVFRGRRREALSSTTRNQSSSQLQTGANQKEGPPTLREDEDPPQLVQELPRTGAPLFIIKFVMI